MKTFTEFLNESKKLKPMEKSEGAFYSGNITDEQICWMLAELYGKEPKDVKPNKFMTFSCDTDPCTMNGKELDVKDFTKIIKSKGKEITNATLIKFNKGFLMLRSNNKELYYFDNIYSFENAILDMMHMHKVNDAVNIADNL